MTDEDLTPDEAMLGAAVRGWLADFVDNSYLNEQESSPDGYEVERWKRIRDLGWHAVTVPDRLGGGGGTLAEASVVAREAGRAAYASPLLATMRAATVLGALNADGRFDPSLTRIADGEPAALVAPPDRTITASPIDGGHQLSGPPTIVEWLDTATDVALLLPTAGHRTEISSDRRPGSATASATAGPAAVGDVGVAGVGSVVSGGSGVGAGRVVGPAVGGVGMAGVGPVVSDGSGVGAGHVDGPAVVGDVGMVAGVGMAGVGSAVGGGGGVGAERVAGSGVVAGMVRGVGALGVGPVGGDQGGVGAESAVGDGRPPAAGDWVVVVLARDELVARLSPVPSIDNERIARLDLDGLVVRGASPVSAVDARRALAGADLLRASLMVGGCADVLDRTARYALERVQFGRPIGGFQAVRHHLARMVIAADAARLTTNDALGRWVPGAEEPAIAEVALFAAARSYVECVLTAAQLHGGVGTTTEHVLHHHFRRAKAMRLRTGKRAMRLRDLHEALVVRGEASLW